MVEHPDFVNKDAWAAVDEIIIRLLALEAALAKINPPRPWHTSCTTAIIKPD
jgi:hypothetical protein